MQCKCYRYLKMEMVQLALNSYFGRIIAAIVVLLVVQKARHLLTEYSDTDTKDYLEVDRIRSWWGAQALDCYGNKLLNQLPAGRKIIFTLIKMQKLKGMMKKIHSTNGICTHAYGVIHFNDVAGGKVGRWNWWHSNIHSNNFRLIDITASCILFHYNVSFQPFPGTICMGEVVDLLKKVK